MSDKLADPILKSAVSKDVLFSELRVIQRRLEELPTEEVDKSRRDLLIASMIGFIVSVTGAVPTKIEALGVEFTRVEQKYFFVFIALVVFYFIFKYCFKFTERRVKANDLIREINYLKHRVGEERDPFSHFSLGMLLMFYLYLLFSIIEGMLPIILGLLSMTISIYAAIRGQSVAQGLALPSLSSPNS